ncbi:unnamed protein product [Polarella glacialis]|uniref:Protein kinase domain-containing protein n=2 Tax=Polarella glacialis TaxID=89957 RepID=A0A813KSS5_POLGL|nr:unnamed protein product [Polarella glacialis]
MSGALEYLHTQQVAHRDVCLEHMVVRRLENGLLFATLINFRSSISTLDVTKRTSSTKCGRPPYMPPEMLCSEAYIPKLADRWSLGVCLLEMAGGLQSLQSVVPWAQAERETAKRLRSFFGEEGSHAVALAAKDGVHDALILAHMTELIQPDARRRGWPATMS